MSSKTEININIEDINHIMNLFGNYDENIRLIEEEFDVKVVTRENEIRIVGIEKDAIMAKRVVLKLIEMIKTKQVVDKNKINYVMMLTKDGEEERLNEIMDDVVCVTFKGKQIKCKTLGQRQYVDAIEDNEIVFGIGPAGTGKTYLAIALAVNAFKNKLVTRIILTRPAVEAGEKLGFLPGDMQNKVDPYLRPLYDALYDIMGGETFQKYMEKGLIEVAPLAYMRGRTLNDAFIILDEAQNTTVEQMKMFLTRLGFGSRIVVTGDITQIDLPTGKKSGLKQITGILKGIKGIEFVNLSEKDVVRHELVQKIVLAYGRFDKMNQQSDEFK